MRENPYPGINAHLNSLLQTPGTRDQTAMWPSFHSHHIANIVDALNQRLPGYYLALNEQSIQTRDPDISCTNNSHNLPGIGWVVDVFEPMPQPKAAIIRELLPQRKLGDIVTRIELLSPSNKPGGSSYSSYATKRTEAVDTGVPLVEIDYLHESPSHVLQLPVYPSSVKAYPYSIVVSDPRPNWSEGKVRVYGFGLKDAVRAFPLPLADDESLIFDLNPVYQHTFRAGRWGDLLDYHTEPERFETYGEDDREFIRVVMVKL